MGGYVICKGYNFQKSGENKFGRNDKGFINMRLLGN